MELLKKIMEKWNDEALKESSDAKLITPDVAEKILRARDSLVAGDSDEAYHWLYQIADPKVNKVGLETVWKDLEHSAGRKK